MRRETSLWSVVRGLWSGVRGPWSGVRWCCGLFLLPLLACAAPALLPTPTPTPLPTPTPTPWPPTATPEPPDTGWQPVALGVEVRSLDAPADLAPERVTVVRVDPAAVRCRVLYAPGQPLPLSAWARQSGALLVINGGYFTEDYRATGLLITHGERYGATYDDFAGMFAVTPDEQTSIRWLRTWPYDPAEPLREALQSFPVLVKPGGVMGFPSGADDGSPARRSVVAQDRQGRLLFLVARRSNFSLHGLAVWLTESDLEVDMALNLDGGASSGLWLMGGTAAAQLESGVPVPAVIAVFSPEGP